MVKYVALGAHEAKLIGERGDSGFDLQFWVDAVLAAREKGEFGQFSVLMQALNRAHLCGYNPGWSVGHDLATPASAQQQEG
jgi:hypothetical protein